MTPATHFSSTQQAAYIAGCEAALDDARITYLRSTNEEHYRAVLDAVEHVRRAKLDAFGVPCVPCDMTGWLMVSRTEDVQCPVCRGEGKVMPGTVPPQTERERDEWHDSRFDREGA